MLPSIEQRLANELAARTHSLSPAIVDLSMLPSISQSILTLHLLLLFFLFILFSLWMLLQLLFTLLSVASSTATTVAASSPTPLPISRLIVLPSIVLIMLLGCSCF